MKKFRPSLFLLFGASLIAGSASAQVVYTDIIPDSLNHEFSSPLVLVNGSAAGLAIYDLDVNNDGIVDFRLKLNGFTFDDALGFDVESYFFVDSCSCDMRNAIICDSNAYHQIQPAPLNFGDLITDTLLLNQTFPYFHYDSIYSFQKQICGYIWDPNTGTQLHGPWYNFAANKYLGLKFFVNGNAYFGYVRISLNIVHWDPYFVVQDYAYEASGGSITAGAGSSFTGIKENAAEDINVSPNPSHDEFEVTTSAGKTETLSVFDTFGKLILEEQVNTGKTFIKAQNWAPGIYLMHLTHGKKTFVKKLIKL